MLHPTPSILDLCLAWRFTEVLPGSFQRNRKEVAGIDFPIVGPLPTGKLTRPLEGEGLVGPYLYMLFERTTLIKYVGVATESDLTSPLDRWIRPDKHGTKYFWAHGTNKRKSKATIKWLADGLSKGGGPYDLYFSNYDHFRSRVSVRGTAVDHDLRVLEQLSPTQFMNDLEHALIFMLQPEWNTQKKKRMPPQHIAPCAAFWIV